MRNSFSICLLFILPFLSGCRDAIELENGEIPDQYLNEAKPYLGTYRGQISGHSSELQLSLVGNRVILSGTSPIASRCEAAFGLLKRIWVNKKNDQYVLTGADFSFDPNKCARDIRGREVNLTFKSRKMSFYLLETTLTEWRCPGYPSRPGDPSYPSPFPPGAPDYGGCSYQPVDYYIEGSLKKQ